MTVPTPPRPAPNRSDSNDSWRTAPTRVNSYASVRVMSRPQGAATIVPSDQPIPEDVPALPAGATLGLYDQETGQSYSTAQDDRLGEILVESPRGSNAWQRSHSRKIALAIADLGPTALQGIAPFAGQVSGQAGLVVNTVGIASQTIKAGYDIFKQVSDREEGLDWMRLAAAFSRLASAAFNTAAAVTGNNPVVQNALSSVGTGFAFAGATADVVLDMKEPPSARPRDLEQGIPGVGEMLPRRTTVASDAQNNRPSLPHNPHLARSFSVPPSTTSATAAEAGQGVRPESSARPPAAGASHTPGLRRRPTGR